jgi:hypothetical protein
LGLPAARSLLFRWEDLVTKINLGPVCSIWHGFNLDTE